MGTIYNIRIKELASNLYSVSIVGETLWGQYADGTDAFESSIVAQTTMGGEANIEGWVRAQEQKFEIAVY